MIYERSFASHPRSSQWHPTLNGNLLPRDVYKNNNNKFWFKCEMCDHDFESSPNNINCNNRWCPFCANKKLCDVPDCTRCYEKSFASHPRSSQWHPTLNTKVPRNVFKHSHSKFWFTCHICEHEINIPLNGVNRGNWCLYCSNPPLKMCEELDCNYCHDKSFASHPRSSHWHPTKNDDKIPRDIFKNSPKKFWFTCEICKHDFEASPNNITNGKKWCAKCKNKTESRLYNALKKIYPLIVYQYKRDWCMNKNHLPFDFCIPEKKVIIELDGPQHFTQVSNWKSPERCLENDIFKQRCANKNGYSVIRIIQEDVWFDRYDWFTRLQEALKNIGDCENVFLCQNHEYDTLQSALIQAC